MAAPSLDPSARWSAGRSVAVLGAGAMARALAVPLARGGAELRLWSRRASQAGRLRNDVLARARGSARRVRAGADLRGALFGADLVLLCVSDSAVRDVARLSAEVLFTREPAPRPPVVLHTSGALGLEPLAPLSRRGCSAGSLHPLLALPPRAGGDPPSFEEAWFVVSGERGAVREARALLELLGGSELRLRAGSSRPLYHAAATLLAAGTVALFDSALEVLETRTTSRTSARRALAGLLGSVTSNLAESAPVAALTGAAARGDVEVVEAHLAALDEFEDAGALYRVLGRRILDLATARGTLAPEARRALEERFEG